MTSWATVQAVVVSPVGSPAISPASSRARALTESRSRRRRSTRRTPNSGVAAAAAMPEGVLLNPAAHLVDDGQSQADDVQRVQHPHGVGQLGRPSFNA